MHTSVSFSFVTFLPFALVFVLASCSRQEDTDWVEISLADDIFHTSEKQYRQGEYEILVLNQSALEFKLGMDKGDAIVYRWDVEMASPELLTAEFHGHTEREGEEPGTVMFYKKHTNGSEEGALVAPFKGIHGWYLKNDSDEDISVQLTVAGFYEEIK